jgi:hypothetical protein
MILAGVSSDEVMDPDGGEESTCGEGSVTGIMAVIMEEGALQGPVRSARWVTSLFYASYC